MEDQIVYVWGDPYKSTVKRIEGDTVYTIPFDEGNADYRAYLAWSDEGNIPGPYPIPTPIDGIEDLGQAKVAASANAHSTAYSLLQPTDWVTARKVDTGEDAPANIEAFRTSVRSASSEKISVIDSKTSLEALAEYLRSDAFADWPTAPLA